MLFDFIIYDIIGYAGNMLWNDRIKRVNQQYHQKYYYDKNEYLACQSCRSVVVNWRNIYEFDETDEIMDHRRCNAHSKFINAHDKFIGINLPKNY